MSSARDSSAQARGVENGTGSGGTGAHQRVGHVGDEAADLRRARRGARAQSSHSSTSTRRCRMVTRLTSAELIARTSARSCMPVAGGDHPGAGGQRVLAEPPLEQQRVERLLHVGRAGRQFVEEQAERLGPLGQQQARRAEHRALADDARNAAHVLGRDLRAEQRAARQARLRAPPGTPSRTCRRRAARAAGSSARAPCTGSSFFACCSVMVSSSGPAKPWGSGAFKSVSFRARKSRSAGNAGVPAGVDTPPSKGWCAKAAGSSRRRPGRRAAALPAARRSTRPPAGGGPAARASSARRRPSRAGRT